MSTESFDRIATLKVFPTTALKNPDQSLSLITTDPTGYAYASRMSDGSPGFRIRFSIDKIQEATPNPTSIYIYNLNKESRERFEKTNNIIVLEAGYGDSSEVIYKGNIMRTRTRKEGADYVTQVEAADGLFASQYSRVDLSLRPGALKSQVVNTLTEAMKLSGVGVGEVRGVKNDGYNQGIVLSGKTVDLLKQVCEKDNLQFTILDNQITIIPFGEASQDSAILISPTTGMIGIPEVGESGRISVKCLMNPKLNPFKKVAIVSKFLMDYKTNTAIEAGQYTAVKVVHSGDTFGGDWFSTVEAV